MIDSHEVAERSRLLSHRYYAERIRACPELIKGACAEIDAAVASGAATEGQLLWARVLRLPLREVLELMLRDDEGGRLLRSNSPFSRSIGVHDPETRTRIWRQARTEVSVLQTSTARSAA